VVITAKIKKVWKKTLMFIAVHTVALLALSEYLNTPSPWWPTLSGFHQVQWPDSLRCVLLRSLECIGMISCPHVTQSWSPAQFPFVYTSFLRMAINTWNMCVMLLILHVNLASYVLRGKDVLSAALMEKGKWIWQECLTSCMNLATLLNSASVMWNTHKLLTEQQLSCL